MSEGGGRATLTVTRTDGSTGAVSVGYTTATGGTATEGADYTFTSGFLDWADGDTASKTFTVPIIDDTDVEGSETVNLSSRNPDGGATLGLPNTTVLTITDNDQGGGVTCGGLTATIVGTAGNDSLPGTAGPDVIDGLDGVDTISGLGGADVLCGGTGNDTILSGPENDRAFGEGGNDVVRGGGGADQVNGAGGTDQLFGDEANDALTGGAGTDRCDGGSGTDTAATCETRISIP